MTVSEPERRQPDEPGAFTRGHWRAAWDVFFGLLRFIARHTRSIHATLGIFLLIEAARQLRGHGGESQVPDCSLALACGSGGWLSCIGTVILGKEEPA